MLGHSITLIRALQGHKPAMTHTHRPTPLAIHLSRLSLSDLAEAITVPFIPRVINLNNRLLRLLKKPVMITIKCCLLLSKQYNTNNIIQN